MMKNVAEIADRVASLLDLDLSGDVKTFSDYRKQKKVEELQQAQTLDPTDTLLLMIVEEEIDAFAEEQTITAAKFLEDNSAFLKMCETIRETKNLLMASGMYEAREALKASVTAAIRHYGANGRKDVMDLIAKRSSLPYLWRNALAALASKLSIHQFLQGDTETTKPLYTENVLGFWSVNDALRIGMTMQSGISLCMIRDTDAIHSYFCFMIRNGGMLSIVTDQTAFSNPRQKSLSRRPDRMLDERMAKAWLPYELLNIKYIEDDDGDIVGFNVPRQEGLVPQQSRAYKMKPIRDLGAAEIVWTAFMFALLTKKFFVENWKAPALTYTGEMIEVPQVLEIAAAKANLPVAQGTYKPIIAAPIKSADLDTKSAMALAQFAQEAVGHNAWMEDRYKDKVGDDVLALAAIPSKRASVLTKDGIDRNAKEFSYLHPTRAGVTRLEEFDLTTFGTEEQVLADRAWIARYNQAQVIEKLANEEFEERKAEILAWWEKAMTGRLDALMAFFKAGEMKVTSAAIVEDYQKGFHNKRSGETNILHITSLEKKDNIWPCPEHVIFGEPIMSKSDGRYRSGHYRCAITDRPATILARFSPKTMDGLAALVGLPVASLPDVLQHWLAQEPYTGNSILNRLDPLDTSIQNPWMKLKFEAMIMLSPFAFPKEERREYPKYYSYY